MRNVLLSKRVKVYISSSEEDAKDVEEAPEDEVLDEADIDAMFEKDFTEGGSEDSPPSAPVEMPPMPMPSPMPMPMPMPLPVGAESHPEREEREIAMKEVAIVDWFVMESDSDSDLEDFLPVRRSPSPRAVTRPFDHIV